MAFSIKLFSLPLSLSHPDAFSCERVLAHTHRLVYTLYTTNKSEARKFHSFRNSESIFRRFAFVSTKWKCHLNARVTICCHLIVFVVLVERIRFNGNLYGFILCDFNSIQLNLIQVYFIANRPSKIGTRKLEWDSRRYRQHYTVLSISVSSAVVCMRWSVNQTFFRYEKKTNTIMAWNFVSRNGFFS